MFKREKIVLSILFVGSVFTLFGFVLVHDGEDLAAYDHFDDRISLVQPSLKVHKGFLRSREPIRHLPQASKGNLTKNLPPLKQEEDSNSNLYNASAAGMAKSNFNRVGEASQRPMGHNDVTSQVPVSVGGVPTWPDSFPSSKLMLVLQSSWFKLVVEIIFGIMYYCMFVSKYPTFSPTVRANVEAIKIQSTKDVESLKEVAFPNCLLSYLSSGPCAACPFHSKGFKTYCLGLLAMTLMPCSTVCVVIFLISFSIGFKGNLEPTWFLLGSQYPSNMEPSLAQSRGKLED